MKLKSVRLKLKRLCCVLERERERVRFWEDLSRVDTWRERKVLTFEREFSGTRGDKVVVGAAFVWTTVTFRGVVDSGACA